MAQTGGDWLGYNYILGNNLILNDVELTWDEDGNLTNTETLLEWTPLNNFSGRLLGNGYIIYGLFCDGANYSGLIGRYTGNLLDGLTVINAYIMGANYLGGIVSYMNNVGGYIQNCTFEGCVNGEMNDADRVGGICGYIHCGNVVNCKASGLIVGDTNVDGIVGYEDAYNIKAPPHNDLIFVSHSADEALF